MAKKNCSKDIHIQLPVLDPFTDFEHLIASKFVKTGKIVDNCGNPRINFLPEPCESLVGDETCEENPLVTEISGSLDVECELTADTVRANNYQGDGCDLKNTDDTKLTSVVYSEDDKTITFTQQNTKKCGDEEIEPEEIILPVDQFTNNTTIEDFDFGIVDDNEDLLSIVDSDKNIFTVDMSKYNNKDEQYIAPGSYKADSDGIITLPYNLDIDDKVKIDISEAVEFISSAEFDNCKGILTLKNGVGEQTIIKGFPTNISLYGEVELNPGFSGKIYYQIENNVMMVVCDFQLSSKDALVGGISHVGRLPVTLLDFQNDTNIKPQEHVRKWLVSMHGTTYGRLERVQLTISTDGVITLRQWQMPERIQDSFTLLIESVDSDLLDALCNGDDGDGEDGEDGGDNSAAISRIYTENSDTIEFEGRGTKERPLIAHFIGEIDFQPETPESIQEKYESLDNSLLKDLEDSVNKIKSVVGEQNKKITELKDLVDTNIEDIDELKNVVNSHAENINELKDLVNTNIEDIDELKDVVNSHAEDINEINEAINLHADEIDDIKERLNDLIDNLPDCSDCSENFDNITNTINNIVNNYNDIINNINNSINTIIEEVDKNSEKIKELEEAIKSNSKEIELIKKLLSEISKYKGVFQSLEKLKEAHPNPNSGDYADVVVKVINSNGDEENKLHKFIWDGTDWIDIGEIGFNLLNITDTELKIFIQARETREVHIFDPLIHDALIIEYVVTRGDLLEMGVIKLSNKHFFQIDVMGDDVEFSFSYTRDNTLLITNHNTDLHAKIQCKLKYFKKY